MDEAAHPARRRERERPLGQPQGHPGRRLPAGPGVGDRRVARHRGGRRCWPPPSARLCEGQVLELQHDLRRRPAPRTAYLASIDGKTASLFVDRAAASAASSAELPRPHIDALTDFGQQLRHGLPDRRRHPRRRRHRRAARQARGPRPGRGRLHAAGASGRSPTPTAPPTWLRCWAAPSTATSPSGPGPSSGRTARSARRRTSPASTRRRRPRCSTASPRARWSAPCAASATT